MNHTFNLNDLNELYDLYLEERRIYELKLAKQLHETILSKEDKGLFGETRQRNIEDLQENRWDLWASVLIDRARTDPILSNFLMTQCIDWVERQDFEFPE